MTQDLSDMKLTKAQRRVLTALVNKGGKATPYDLVYPRSPLMHRLFMAGYVRIEGPVNGFWTITPAGRAALSNQPTDTEASND